VETSPTCQWCGCPLEPGESHCPRCGRRTAPLPIVAVLAVSSVLLALLVGLGVYILPRGPVTKHWTPMVVDRRHGTPSFAGYLTTRWAAGSLSFNLQISAPEAWFYGCDHITVTFEDRDGLELAQRDIPGSRFVRIQHGQSPAFEVDDGLEMRRSTYERSVRWGLRWRCKAYEEQAPDSGLLRPGRVQPGVGEACLAHPPAPGGFVVRLAAAGP
jgi:hypothetical protein